MRRIFGILLAIFLLPGTMARGDSAPGADEASATSSPPTAAPAPPADAAGSANSLNPADPAENTTAGKPTPLPAFSARGKVGQNDSICVGTKRDKLYHRLGCKEYLDPKAGDRVVFVSFVNAAEAGYSPCPDCLPPMLQVALAKDEPPPDSVRFSAPPLFLEYYWIQGREPWLNTGFTVFKGQKLFIKASGCITHRDQQGNERQWNADGLDNQSKPSSRWKWRQRNYLWARIDGETFRLGKDYFAAVPRTGMLEIGFRNGGSEDETFGFFDTILAVFPAHVEKLSSTPPDAAAARPRTAPPAIAPPPPAASKPASAPPYKGGKPPAPGETANGS